MPSCCSPIASVCPPPPPPPPPPRMRPLQLLLAACVHFESAAAPGPDCIRFNCCSLFASASSCCSPILRPLQLLLHARHLRPLQLLLPIASALVAAPRLRPLRVLLPDCMHPFAAPVGFQPNVLEHSSWSLRFSK